MEELTKKLAKLKAQRNEARKLASLLHYHLTGVGVQVPEEISELVDSYKYGKWAMRNEGIDSMKEAT